MLSLEACKSFPTSHKLVEVNGVTQSTSERTLNPRDQVKVQLPLPMVNRSNPRTTSPHHKPNKVVSRSTLPAHHVQVLATLVLDHINLRRMALLHSKLDPLDHQPSQCKALSLVSQ